MSINNKKRGFTLIEIIVSIGLFSMVVLLTSGAYFIMISINRQAQGIATGINNLSFALETMTRTIRTGKNYWCGNGPTPGCVAGTTFSVTDQSENVVSYALSGGAIMQNSVALTDQSVTVSSLLFYVGGALKTTDGNYKQPHVTIIITGTVSYGAGKTKDFTIETGATMRGTDL